MDPAQDLLAREDRVRAHHTCSCVVCEPSVVVDTTRHGDRPESHVSVRFWDVPSEEQARKRTGEILLDGEIVSGAFEALLGDPGTVWAYRTEPDGVHRCVRCIEQAARQGVLTEDRMVQVGQDGSGLVVHTAINLCTEKLTGQVELRALAQEEEVR